MVDKSAVTKAAQKFALKGQVDKAIAEWYKILDEERDGNIHNTIGDLYYKKGDEARAVESFSKAANIYKKDGFYLKAIALYKKILNVYPEDVNALISLAKLDAERGFIGNAIESYFHAADIFKREGSTENATKIVEKILQLSPSDVRTRLKIADFYTVMGHKERASNELSSIAGEYLDKGDHEKSHEYFEKSIALDPENIQTVVGLSKLDEALNKPDMALARLEEALSRGAGSKEVLLTYSGMAMRSGKKDIARETLQKILSRHPNEHGARKMLGSLYIEDGETEKAWKVSQPYIEEVMESDEPVQALDLLGKFRETMPFEVLQRLIQIYRKDGDRDELIAALHEMGRYHEDAGAPDEALKQYRELAQLNPGDPGTEEKIREMEIALGIAVPETAEVRIEEEAPADQSQAISMEDLLETNSLAEEFISIDESDAEPAAATGLSPEEFDEKKAEADFFAQQGLNEEAAQLYEELLAAEPENAMLKAALEKVRSADSQSEEIIIEPVAGDIEIEPAIVETQQDLPAEPVEIETTMHENQHEAPAGTAEEEHHLQPIFDLFPSIQDEADHFNEGLTLKAQGKLDEAIRKFELAAKDNEKDSLRMLADCHAEKGSYPLAIAGYSKLLSFMPRDDEEYLHIKYLLAQAHLTNRDKSRALELFMEILSDDAGYKDTARQVETLKLEIPDFQPKAKAKRNRVSYI